MRTILGIMLVLSSVSAADAQSRKALLCSEDISFAVKEQSSADGSIIDKHGSRRFSLVWNQEFLNLISAGRTDFYECQNVIPRRNEGGPRNTVKCQNGMYFVTVDLLKLTFVRATLDPQNRSNVEVAYGSCGPI